MYTLYGAGGWMKTEKQQVNNQTNIRLDAERLARINRIVARYNKQNRAMVFLELFDRYVVLYEQAEEACLKEVEQQVGKNGLTQLPMTI
jgi:hypothetical protein